MARYTDPVCRICRREGMKLFLKGEPLLQPKCAFERRSTPPGMNTACAAARSASTALQLREKQKVRTMLLASSSGSSATTSRRPSSQGHDRREPAPHARDAPRQRRLPAGLRASSRRRRASSSATATSPSTAGATNIPSFGIKVGDTDRGPREPSRREILQDRPRDDEGGPDPRMGERRPGEAGRAAFSPSRRASRCRSSSTSSSSSSTTRARSQIPLMIELETTAQTRSAHRRGRTRRQPEPLRGQPAPGGVRHDARQRAASRPPELAGGGRRHSRPDRRRLPRVQHDRERQGGRHPDRPQHQEAAPPLVRAPRRHAQAR